jgi:bromodomain and WD repeat domain-containing protein 1/3
LFTSLIRNIRQRRLKSQAKVIPELADSPPQSTSSRAVSSATHKTSAGTSSGVTSGDSSDSAESSERIRRNRPRALRRGSVLSGEKQSIVLVNMGSGKQENMALA